jgi:hypothetical protein
MRNKISRSILLTIVSASLTNLGRAVLGSAPFQWITICLMIISSNWVPLGVASILEEVPKVNAKQEARAQSDGGPSDSSGASGFESSLSSLVVKDSVENLTDDETD